MSSSFKEATNSKLELPAVGQDLRLCDGYFYDMTPACLLFLTLYFLALPFSRPKSAALSQLDLIMLIRSQKNLFFLLFLAKLFPASRSHSEGFRVF